MALRWRRLELMAWSFLLSFAFYPGVFGFLAWFALVRPLWIISSLSRREAFYAAYFFSFFFNLFAIYWIAMVTPPGMVAAVVIVSSYYTAVFMIFWKLHRVKPLYGFVAMPFLWVGMEYFRTLTEFTFPWSDLGYTQSYYLLILQIVSVTSVHGLSFLIVTVNILLLQMFRRALSPEQRITSLFVAVAIVLGLVAYGWIELPPFPEKGDYEIALLQGSVPIADKWKEGNEDHSFRLYDSLTRVATDSAVKLYVWPETSAPCYLSHNDYGRQWVSRIAKESNGYHLVGALGARLKNGQTRYYNSCYQINPDGLFERRYDKVKLVPFSEHVPYQDYLPFLQKGFLRKYLTFIDQYGVQWWSDFYPGDSVVLFELPGATYSVLICFETTSPEFVRGTILDGANFVVGITNDTWFGRSVGVHQHARIFVTRAVENRCWFVRTANSGLTFIVDPYGRIRSKLDLYEVAALKGKIRLLYDYSFFTRYGDLTGRYCFLFTVSVIAILICVWLVGRLLPKKPVSSS